MMFKALAPSFTNNPVFVENFAGHWKIWLNKLKKEHDELKSRTSGEKAEIFRRIDAIEAAGEASTR